MHGNKMMLTYNYIELLKSILNHRDPDYFDLYDNPDWKPTTLYQEVITRISRCLYFLSGPKVMVPLIGECSKFILFNIETTSMLVTDVV